MPAPRSICFDAVHLFIYLWLSLWRPLLFQNIDDWSHQIFGLVEILLQTSHMARRVAFAVARIRVGNRRNIAYFSLWHPKYMGDRGSKKAYTGPRTGIYLPTKFGCDRSIVVGCRLRNDRQTDRQTEWNDNKAHSLRTWRSNNERTRYFRGKKPW